MSPSPVSDDSPPDPATRPTPPSATAKPAHATGPVVERPRAAATSATRAGIAPTISAAWVTLVRAMPRFWSRTTPPKPTTPHRTSGRDAEARSAPRATKARTGAAMPKRATASHAGSSQPRATFDSGTVRPQRSPAVTSAASALRRCWGATEVMPPLSSDRARLQVIIERVGLWTEYRLVIWPSNWTMLT